MIPLALLLLAANPFAIEVVDSRTGRGVPLIELRTVNDIRYVTDSAGVAAFDEPGLMGRSVFFHVRGHGYEFPKDGFGIRGKALDVVEGGRARIEVRRVNVAERLYRITGAGIYRDSAIVGRKPPTLAPLLNAAVLGSDSVQEATFRGKVHWFWGDTNRPGYPLGNFHTPTATSRLPTDGGLDPEIGVDLDYAKDADGFAAPSAKMPGDGPTWVDGLTVVKDRDGSERMFAAYAKVRPPLKIYERGLMEFDPETRRFAKLGTIPVDSTIRPFGHTFHHVVDGVEYVYFADPFPTLRVRADVEDWKHPDRYEAFAHRGGDETPTFAWTRGARPLDIEAQGELIRSGAIQPNDAPFKLWDVDDGHLVVAHRGSTSWNAYRGRWVLIATEINGNTSHLGEVWFAEADTPTGPWAYARKVVTHDKYSFYNPKQHPSFAKDDGRTLFFEGTYTTTFSGSTNPTPRYEYNQIMYKLDLADPRLNLPVAIYEVEGRLVPRKPGHRVAFFAFERPGPNTVPIEGFHVLAMGAKSPPSCTNELREVAGEARPGYFSEEFLGVDAKGARPVGRVWRAGSRVILPAD